MTEMLTEFDVLQAAMRQIDLDEDVLPIHNGKYLFAENAESFRKMKLILNTPEMVKAHKFIYNLDPEQLSEDEIDQVNKIFAIGVNRGFITEPEEDKPVANPYGVFEPNEEAALPACTTVHTPSKTTGSLKIPCWTVLYSATKNGEIKTGESYSTSIDVRSAKADCMAKLARCGYDNISILAVEQGDPDSCGFCQTATTTTTTCDKECDCTADDSCNNVSCDCAATETPAAEEKPAVPAEPKEQFKMVLEISDVDPESFLTGRVAAWIEDNKSKFGPEVTLEVTDATEFGSNVQIIASKDILEKIYAEYVHAKSVEDLEKRADDFAEFNALITPVAEIKESGNPYAAGMTTANIGGATSVAPKVATPVIKEDDDEDESDAEADEDTDDGKKEDDEDNDASDDSDDSDSSEDNTDEPADDEGSEDDSEDDSEDAGSNDEGKEEEKEESNSEESSTSDDDDSADDESADDSSEDGEDSDDDKSDDNSEDNDSEDDDDAEEDKDEDDGLSEEEKAELKNEYKKAFKEVILKCKFEDKCFDDLTIDQKVKFFTELAKKWSKNEPNEFMTTKEIDQLNKVVVKK